MTSKSSYVLIFFWLLINCSFGNLSRLKERLMSKDVKCICLQLFVLTGWTISGFGKQCLFEIYNSVLIHCCCCNKYCVSLLELIIKSIVKCGKYHTCNKHSLAFINPKTYILKCLEIDVSLRLKLI